MRPMLSHFSSVRLQPIRLPGPWDSPGKNPGVSCHLLLQRIFPTQGSNPCLLCLLKCRQILYPLSHQASPIGNVASPSENPNLVSCVRVGDTHHYMNEETDWTYSLRGLKSCWAVGMDHSSLPLTCSLFRLAVQSLTRISAL